MVITPALLHNGNADYRRDGNLRSPSVWLAHRANGRAHLCLHTFEHPLGAEFLLSPAMPVHGHADGLAVLRSDASTPVPARVSHRGGRRLLRDLSFLGRDCFPAARFVYRVDGYSLE